MGESRRFSTKDELDIYQILMQAHHRWLRSAEICEILQNYQNFCLAKEPPDRPPSGSLFLFDKKVVRNFRKDGHNWRKKKDGKSVKEAHERLKAGSVDVLHCYYAHGEEEENFQRRSYWMLEKKLSNIVFVHYLEVKGNRANCIHSMNADSVPNSLQTEEEGYNHYEVVSSSTSKFQARYQKGSSHVTDTTIFNGTQASEWEDAESEYRNNSSPGIHTNVDIQPSRVVPVPKCPVPLTNRKYQALFSTTPSMTFNSLVLGERSVNPTENSLTYEPHQDLEEVQIFHNLVQESNACYQSLNTLTLPLSTKLNAISINHGHGTQLLDHVISGIVQNNSSSRSHANGIEEWQVSNHQQQCKEKGSDDEKSDRIMNSLHVDPSYRKILFDDGFSELKAATELDLDDLMGILNPCVNEVSVKPIQLELELQAPIVEGTSLISGSENTQIVEIDKNHPAMKPLLNGIQEGLNKLDSFDRWMSKELGEFAGPSSHPTSEANWDTVGENDDDSHLPVQVPVDQLFSIIDFSPNWAYSGSDVKVLIMGRLLRSPEDVNKHKLACMFGEYEVPAEIISDGVLRCHTPLHAIGLVPFYITCSNRLACSEVREFEFRQVARDGGTTNFDETYLHMRFGKLLSLGSSSPLSSLQSCTSENSHLCSKISALLKDDNEWEQMLNLTNQDEQNGKDQLLQKLLKEKLHFWLLQKISEGENRAHVLDQDGQGVLHFAAALGYQWAIAATIAAGVCINFRDINGWTALHWASFYGREHMVAFLISLGADPGTVTHPTSNNPVKTPADLASSNGHKGIAGYLAELALSCHVSSLELDSNEIDRSSKTRETSCNKWLITPVSDDGYPARGSLKESLAAVHNAAQAAARIHEVYRNQSFQRKQIKEYDDTRFNDRALSLLSLKTKKNFEPHAAALKIQNKFRGWKGRKDFLLIRQRIIKIQAVVRGHQVRKYYKKIIWSVRFLYRVILRWRRKGKGLSIFKSSNNETQDDFDFLKDGQKQSELRLQKALDRVKSMVRYPEARDQYGRLLNVVSEMQGMKAAYDKILHNPEAIFDDDLVRLDALLEDDIFMHTEVDM